MPRPPKPTYVPPRKGRGGGFWITRAFGEFSEVTGRRKGVKNHDIGPPGGREGAANRAAAQRWVDGLAEAAAAGVKRGADPLVEDLVVMYLTWSERHVAARTVQGHKERLQRFIGFRHAGRLYGEMVARDLKPADLSRFIRGMKEAKRDGGAREGYAPVYINSIVLSVQAMLNWAARPVEDRTPPRILDANPFAGVERPRNPRPPKRYCGPEARRAFLEYAFVRACRQPVGSPGWRFDRLAVALFRFAEATGCRPDEACRLEWAHIDWDGARAVLKGKSTAKTGRDRVLPLTEAMVRLLRAIGRLPGRHGRFVFTHQGRDGGEPSLAGVPWTANALAHKFRQWRTEAIAAGLPIEAEGPHSLTLYGFRRDMGADILRLTGSHAESAEVLGHSPEINSRHYASFEDERAVELARRVAERRRSGG